MSSPTKRIVTYVTIVTLMFVGCRPGRPLYFYERGDLQYYIDQQVDVRYADTEIGLLEETTETFPPLTIRDSEITEIWDMTLEDAVNIALKNTKTIRATGRPTQVGFTIQGTNASVIDNPDAPTIFEVGIRESEPGQLSVPGQITSPELLSTNTTLDSNQGVEAALAEFDAHVSSSLFWNTTNRPRNFVFPGLELRNNKAQDVTFESTLSKKAATGTLMTLRSATDYTSNNNILGVNQTLESAYTSRLELEINQPLLRGRGTAINRTPILIARIGGDQTVANTEFFLQNMLTQIEIAYWGLQGAYRQFEIAKESVSNVVKEYQRITPLSFEKTPKDYARVIAVYYQYVANLNTAYAELQRRETDMRFLLGLASNDGRFIRPVDEPVTTEVAFDWYESLNEALVRRPNLRIKQWEIKKKELAVNYAKNGLLAQLNFVFLYRFLGLGDKYYGNSTPFPTAGSGSVNNLFSSSNQELRMGLQGGYTVGQRREMMNVRNAQLKLARERARLEDMELDVSRELQNAFNALVFHFEQAKIHANRWAALKTKIDNVLRSATSVGNEAELEQLYIDQQNAADSQIAFYESISNYNQFIALIHRLKGTSLEYYNVQFGEGPWPDKAYYDARELARKRSASAPINYGFTRPGTISAGNGPGPAGAGSLDPIGIPVTGDLSISDGIIEGDVFVEGPGNRRPVEPGLLPPRNNSIQEPVSNSIELAPQLDGGSQLPRSSDAPKRTAASILKASYQEPIQQEKVQHSARIRYDQMGLGDRQSGPGGTRATLRPVD